MVNHYGLDWLAMVLTFGAIYLLGNKRRSGFAFMMAGNLCWVGVGVSASSIAMTMANVVFFTMNLRGLVRWSRKTEAST
jgi:nicotinamide riboside transporter PnuC